MRRALLVLCRSSARWRPECHFFAEQNIEEYVEVPVFLSRDDDDFLLRIEGDSMIDAGIHNDDLIVVHRQASADNGDIVVALVGDEATTKRFYREGGRFGFSPRTSLYEPLSCSITVDLVGRRLGVLRRL